MSSPRLAILLTLGLRVFYTVVGALLAPFIHTAPSDIAGVLIDPGLIPEGPSAAFKLLGIWQRWDVFWYVHIARNGYDIPRGVVFFPLYPALIRIFTLPLRNPYVAGLVVSTIAAFFFFWGLENLLLLDFKADLTRRAVLVAMTWPAAFTLFMGYPESLLCALMVWCLYAARRGQWEWSGALGFLAGLTKAAGALLVIPLLMLAWKKGGREKLLAALSVGGTLCYYGFLWATNRGTPDSVYAAYWNTTTQFPLWTLLEAVADAFGPGWPIILENLPLLLLVVFLVLKKRYRMDYMLFGLAAVLMFLTKRTGALLQSTLRYLLIVFPVYPAAAHYLRRRWVLYPVLGVSMLMNVALMFLFLNWWLVA